MSGAGLILILAALATVQADTPSIDYPSLPDLASSAKGFLSPGWVLASKAEGDLNRDGRADLALALWTEQATNATSPQELRDSPPYRLVVAFGQPGGGYRLITDNKTLIEPAGFSLRYEDPLGDGSLRIVRGSLEISRELLRGHYRYRFRWSDNAFRLIGYENAESNGGCITVTSINYLTKRAKLEAMPIGDDRRKTIIRRVKHRPLVALDDVNIDFFTEGMGVIGNWPGCPRTDE